MYPVGYYSEMKNKMSFSGKGMKLEIIMKKTREDKRPPMFMDCEN
jgi:hypothetical protein